MTPSRPSVRAGSVSIELVNFGMDTHDLVIKATKAGAKPVRFKQLSPRGRSGADTAASPLGAMPSGARFPTTRPSGMHATLVVKK